jgi:DNA repair protein RecO (recombination protein O)
MKSIKTEALLLHATPYGESDLVVALLTRQCGRLSALARGARRSRRRFGGALDYLHLFEALIQPGRSGLGRLLGVELLRPFDAARSGEAAYWAGCHILEVARLGTKEGDSDEALFGLVEASLGALDQGRDPGSLVAVFRTRILALLGYALPIESCPACGRRYADRGAARVGDTILCVGCAGPGGLALSPGALRTLEAALSLPLGRLGTLRTAGSIHRELTPLLEAALCAALGKEPRSISTGRGEPRHPTRTVQPQRPSDPAGGSDTA